MGILNTASSASNWRGYEYYKDNKVKSFKKIDETTYSGEIIGTSNYKVVLDLKHPKKSTCNCPFAEGNTKVCKHMVALYFAIFPKEAEEYYERVVQAEIEEEEWQEELENRVIDCVMKMNKSDLQDALLQVLFDGPEWVYERFLREHDLDYDD